MHWRNKTRDWADAPPDRISWRLVQGLEDLILSIEDRGGGQIDYVRLRKPPTGNQARRSKSRYIGWDNLDDCRLRSAQEIAAELTAAAFHLSVQDKCGGAFEAQVNFTAAGQSGQSKSISFNLDDGPAEDDDEDDDDLDAVEFAAAGEGLGGLPWEMSAKLMTENPLMLLMMQTDAASRRLVALAEQQMRVERARYDKILHALTSRHQQEETLVEQFRKMVDPMLVHAAQMTQLGYEALHSQAEEIRDGKAAEADLELKKARLETIADGFRGLKELANGLGLDLLARKLGVDPAELRAAAAAAAASNQTASPQGGANPAPAADPAHSPAPEQPMPSIDDEIVHKGRELRASLTVEQLDAIEKIHAPIAEKLRALGDESTAAEIRAAFGEIKDVLATNLIVMREISNTMAAQQQLAVLQLLDLIYAGG